MRKVSESGMKKRKCVHRLTPRVSPSSWLVTVVKRKVSELVIGTTKDISA
jgi:hypothetical protein